jgi:hypothetical protein
MIEKYLSNTNESATMSRNFYGQQLNKASVAKKSILY